VCAALWAASMFSAAPAADKTNTQKMPESTRTIIPPPVQRPLDPNVAGLVDRESFSSCRPVGGNPEALKRYQREGQQQAGGAQTILIKGQLGQFKLMCPLRWELNVQGFNRGEHYVYVPVSRNNITERRNRLSGRKSGITSSPQETTTMHGPPAAPSLPSREGTRCLSDAEKGVEQGYAASLELTGLGYSAEISACSMASKPQTKQQPLLECLIHESRGLTEKPNSSTEPAGAEGCRIGYSDGGRHTISNLGKSHKISHFVDTRSVDVVALRPNANSMTILIFGISRSVVNQIAAEISRYKKPNIYNAKGISNSVNPFTTKSRS